MELVLISFNKPDARKTLKYYYRWHEITYLNYNISVLLCKNNGLTFSYSKYFS